MKLGDSDIQLETQFLNKKIDLEIDTFHFTTVLFNLLDNAVKYSKENPKIKIRTKVISNELFIEIEDNGIGMNAKSQAHIFDKFFRVSSGNVHNVKGLGLGLFYVKQIIKAHHGDILVKSKLGEGTCFTVIFPI